MNNLTVTELFALYLLKRRRNFYHGTVSPYLLNCMLAEMYLNGNIAIDEELYIETTNERVPTASYHRMLFDLIKEKNRKIFLRAFVDVVTQSEKWHYVCGLLENSLHKGGIVELSEERNWLHMRKVLKFNYIELNAKLHEIKWKFFYGNQQTEFLLFSFLVNQLFITRGILTKQEKKLYRKRIRTSERSRINELKRVFKTSFWSMFARTQLSQKSYAEY